eukprot:Blabericola_migrator_1__5308@NODE_2724_length_2423_cov_8_553480_g1706_i0_p1_GENE_NODE_2724_length_2423_cov_8_553480_g1706_i0NODE_2724_length_2423_cov_8_553480_g1706_i0_p1_ORF_typecomplete_len166_score13_76_NODE_2724_length_2423_cov_8_553480_g1706_i016152112
MKVEAIVSGKSLLPYEDQAILDMKPEVLVLHGRAHQLSNRQQGVTPVVQHRTYTIPNEERWYIKTTIDTLLTRDICFLPRLSANSIITQCVMPVFVFSLEIRPLFFAGRTPPRVYPWAQRHTSGFSSRKGLPLCFAVSCRRLTMPIYQSQFQGQREPSLHPLTAG